MDTGQRLRKRRWLYLLLGSIALGAVLGVAIVLRGKWHWFEVRVMLTTIVLAIASLMGLACDLSRTPRGSNRLPLAGLWLTLLAALLYLIGIWFEDVFGAELYWKCTACVSIAAVASVHIALLSVARLARRFRWVYMLTCQIILGLAALLCIMIVWEIDEARLFRFIIVAAIVDVALTLTIPVLHRLSKTDERPAELHSALEERNLAALDLEITQLEKQLARLKQLRAELAGEHPPAPQVEETA